MPEELEADRVEKLATGFIDGMKPPTRFDLVRPDAWFSSFKDQARKNLEPLLQEASGTAAERVRRIEAEQRATRAEKAASEAEKRFQRRLEDNSYEQSRNALKHISGLDVKIRTLTSDLKQEAAAREKAEEQARRAETEAVAAKTTLGHYKAFLSSTLETMKRFVGDGYRSLRQQIDQDWEKHPANPTRAEPDRKSSLSSGPSPS